LLKAFEIAKKDLKIEFRSKGTLNFMVLFSLVVSFMFSIAVPSNVIGDVAISLLLLVFIFVGILGYTRAFLREAELETIDGLRISPISPTAVLLGKIIYNVILMLLIEIIILPIFVALFNLNVDFLLLFLSVTAGNLAFVIVISSLSMLVLKSKARELLMPIIIFPVIFPVISSTITALNSSVVGEINYNAFLLIGSYTVMMLTVAMLTFDYLFVE